MNSPNLTPDRDSQNVLKVVPPQQAKKQPVAIPQTTAPPAEKKPPEQPETQRSFTGILMVGAIAVAIGGISFLEIPNYVTGETKIASRNNARQLVTMPVAGQVKINVEHKQKIKAGQPIGIVQSDDLDNKLIEAERELERAKIGVNSAQKQLIVSQARLGVAKNNEAIARNRTNRQIAELNNRASHPQIRRIEREQEMIPQEIAAIEAEIIGIEAEIIGLQGQLNSATKTVSAYEGLQIDGAIRRKDLWDARSQQTMLSSQIQKRRSLIQVKRHQIEQKRSFKAAKIEQANEASKQMGDTLNTYEDELARISAQTQTAEQELEAAAAEVQNQQQLVAKWEANLKQRKQQREKLKLIAESAGMVTTQDLDLKQNKPLEMGQEVLTIVDIKQLTAEVKIRQEDKDFIKPNAAVKFYPQGGTKAYTATVQEDGISPVIRTEEKQQKPMLNVKILIDNNDGFLLPGADGYAHIETPKLRVYEKAGHEFNKLFNFGKYFPWLAR